MHICSITQHFRIEALELKKGRYATYTLYDLGSKSSLISSAKVETSNEQISRNIEQLSISPKQHEKYSGKIDGGESLPSEKWIIESMSIVRPKYDRSDVELRSMCSIEFRRTTSHWVYMKDNFIECVSHTHHLTEICVLYCFCAAFPRLASVLLRFYCSLRLLSFCFAFASL